MARAERFIEAADKPLIGLSAVAVVLYLLELRAVAHGEAASEALRVCALVADVIFSADVVSKIAVRRGAYLRSPWALIDLLSCLPAVALIAHVPGLAAMQFVRFFRVLRIMRTLRLLRALHAIPALSTALQNAPEDPRAAQRLTRAMNTAVVAYSVAFVGLIELIHASEPSVARAAQIELYAVLSAIAAICMFVVLMYFQLQDASSSQLRALLNVALPRQVAEHVFKNPRAYQDKHRMPATIMFMDFVGFTKTSESLDIPALSRHLERAMDAVVKQLASYDLIIDKFIGDSIMSFRGGPLVEGNPNAHAIAVVRGALAGNRALRELNDPCFSLMKIGGASTDDCLIGTFGTSTRLSYTVLGDGVNLASRLEGASAQCRTSTLFCEKTRELCGAMDDVIWRRFGRIRVKGKALPITVYEALDREHGGAWIAEYEEGVRLFEQREIASARAAFERANTLRSGGDGPSQLYLERCAAQWDDAFVTHK